MASKRKVLGSGLEVQKTAGTAALVVDESTGAVTAGGAVSVGDLTALSLKGRNVSVSTGTYNDYDVSSTLGLLGVTGSVTFTGFAGGSGGRILFIAVSNTSVTINHNSTSSAIGNRIFTLTAANVTRSSGGFTLFYDNNNGRWVQVG